MEELTGKNSKIAELADLIQMPAEVVLRLSEPLPQSNSSKKLPLYIVHPKPSASSGYPVESNGTTYSSMVLKVIYNREKTGYE